jgi:hypothetical protein
MVRPFNEETQMTKRRALSFGAAVALAALGCNVGSSSPSAGTAMSPVESFCIEALTALTERQAVCQHLPSKAGRDRFLQLTNAGECRNLARAAASHRVKHDPSKEQSCLDALLLASCDSIDAGLSAVAACAEAVSGQVPADGSCYMHMDLECAGGARCQHADASSDSCPGTCKPAVGVGGACASSSECTAGARCPSSICIIARASGACASDEECADGYLCSGNPGACTATKKLGERCTPGAGECQDYTYCAGDPAICTLWPSAGAACSEATESEDYRGCLGGACVNGTCVEHLAVGASCTASTSTRCSSEICTGGACAPIEGACLSN